MYIHVLNIFSYSLHFPSEEKKGSVPLALPHCQQAHTCPSAQLIHLYPLFHKALLTTKAKICLYKLEPCVFHNEQLFRH